MERGAWWAIVCGVAKSRTQLSTHTHSFAQDGGHLAKSLWEEGAHSIAIPKPHLGQFNSVASDSLRPHGLQHARPPSITNSPEFTPTHVHGVGDAIQASHPLSSPSPPAFYLAQHQGLFLLLPTHTSAKHAISFPCASFGDVPPSTGVWKRGLPSTPVPTPPTFAQIPEMAPSAHPRHRPAGRGNPPT